MTSPKCELDEVDKAIIQFVECHFEDILWYLPNRKRKFFQVEKSYDSNGRMALESHCLPLDKFEIDFGEVEKAIFQVVARLWEHIFFLLTTPKCDLVEVEKAILKGS